MQYNNFKIERIDGVALVYIGKAEEKVNTLSLDMFDEFEDMFNELFTEELTKAVVLISSKKDFIVGADINIFGKVQKAGDFKPISAKLYEVLQKIETSRKPVVAAINGTCYGGGLELALACTARMCSDDRSTKFALPEVKLGLLPGGGGTQRLPRLIGIQRALDMMLTGKNAFAIPALKMGLVDQVVNKNKLQDAAVKYALSLVGKPIERKVKLTFMNRIIEGPLKSIVYKKATQMVMRMTYGNYPSPIAIIKCVKEGMEKGMSEGLKVEAAEFEKLLLSPVSKQLINIFFAMTEKKKNPYAQLVKPVDRLGMLGAGFMGEGIAEVSIMNDMDVVLKDIKMESISKAYRNIWKSLEGKVRKKVMPMSEAQSRMVKLSQSLDYSDFRHCDLVIEAVFEELNIKQSVLKDCEAVMHEDAIFASNTSALPIKDIAAKSSRKDRIIGMHYFSPVPKMPLLEIVKTPDTADWVVGTCLEVGIRQGKTCIVVNDGPGFYTTRILAPMLNETLLLLEEGADMLQIDKVMKKFGFPVGPVTLIDEVGIDVGAHIMSGDLMKYFQHREGLKISTAMKAMFDAGYCGRKNGKGFFVYDAKGKKVRGKVNEEIYSFFGGRTRKQLDETMIRERCSAVFINEAFLCLQENIIENPLDGDVGAIFGLGFPPFLGGPFRYTDSMGADDMFRMMERLYHEHGGRFKPADILKQYAGEKRKFYS